MRGSPSAPAAWRNRTGHHRAPGVAMLCHPYHRGGVTRWMIDAAEEWRRRGSAVWFVTPWPRRPFTGGAGRPPMMELLNAAPPELRPTVVAPVVGWQFELGTSAYRRHVYAKAVLKGVPAGVPVIVSDDPAVWAAGALCARRNPLIGVLHADDRAYYELASSNFLRSSALVAVSRRIAQRVSRELPVDSRAQVATIPCGIPMTGAAARQPQTPGPLRLISVGRLDDYQKRSLDLIRVAISLRQRGVAYTFDIVGDGPERQRLATMIDGGGLQQSVRLLGWLSQEKVARALDGSDVLLMTSNFEGMPVAVMEALRAGCAVVSSRVSGVEDLENDALAKECLRIFPVGDIEAATSLVLDVARLHVPSRVEAARDLARREFSIASCIDRYDVLLDRITPSSAMSGSRTQPAWLETSLSLPLAGMRATKLRLARVLGVERRTNAS